MTPASIDHELDHVYKATADDRTEMIIEPAVPVAFERSET
jgi:hypothetical protein